MITYIKRNSVSKSHSWAISYVLFIIRSINLFFSLFFLIFINDLNICTKHFLNVFCNEARENSKFYKISRINYFISVHFFKKSYIDFFNTVKSFPALSFLRIIFVTSLPFTIFFSCICIFSCISQHLFKILGEIILIAVLCILFVLFLRILQLSLRA